MERIGVRELRQYASRYLARVANGESLQVTDRGRPVALLVPVGNDQWQTLLASGRVTPPADQTDALNEPPSDYGIDGSVRLAEMREGER